MFEPDVSEKQNAWLAELICKLVYCHQKRRTFWNKFIYAGKYFGTVVCDVPVPEVLKEHFAEMPPIFKNIEVSIDDVGRTWKIYAKTSANLRHHVDHSSVDISYGKWWWHLPYFDGTVPTVWWSRTSWLSSAMNRWLASKNPPRKWQRLGAKQAMRRLEQWREIQWNWLVS